MATVLKQFSMRLYFLRKQRNLTQEELAGKAKLHPGYISALERGTKIPTLVTLDHLAHGLGVGVRDLFDFSNEGDGEIPESDDIRLLLKRLMKCDAKMVSKIRKAVDVLTDDI
ncbi:MAG: helix-turn-helix transcriptional regulator [Planctomycetota bacterium]